MVPAAVLIAFLLLGVEEIGVQIEEPFGILPLGATSLARHCETMCNSIMSLSLGGQSDFCNPGCNVMLVI